MPNTRTVGQTLVTDPLIGRSSGYQLVGRSPSVSDQEAALLETRPLVTDELHAEDDPVAHFAFFRLPSGRYGYSRRFAHGKRREVFNRIVAHTLLLDRQVVEALAMEPMLLNSHCTYPGGNLSELGGRLAAVFERPSRENAAGATELDELRVGLPDDAEEARWDVLGQRLDFLRKQRGAARLERDLAGAFGVLEAEGRLLLPSTLEDIQLLLLVWSALPWRDRESLAWTTHLALNASTLFAMANVPAPEQALARIGDAAWQLPHTSGSGSAAGEMAEMLVTDPALYRDFLHFCREDDLTIAHPRAIHRLAHWLRKGGHQVLKGFASTVDLRSYLFSIADADDGPASGDLAARERAPYHLTVVAATVRNLLEANVDPEMILPGILNDIRDTGTFDALLRPEVVEEVAEDPADELGIGVVAAAGLALERLTAPPRGREAVERLWRAFRGYSLADGRESVSLFHREIGIEMAMALGRRNSERTADALRAIARPHPDALAEVARRLEPGRVDFFLRRKLFGVAVEVKDDLLALKLARKAILPLLREVPDLLEVVEPEWLEEVVAALHPDPEAYVDALVDENERLFAAARPSLDRWATAPGVIARVAEAIRRRPDVVERLAKRDGTVGMTRIFAFSSAPFVHWAQVAAAEAARLDGGLAREANAREFATQLEEVPATDDEPTVDLLLSVAESAISKRIFLRSHRELMEKVWPGLVARPGRAARVFKKLTNLPGAGYLEWGDFVHRLATAAAGAGAMVEASNLCRDWWAGLAAQGISEWPMERLEMLELLVADDQAKLVRRFTPHLAQLGAAADRLVEQLARMIPPDEETRVDFQKAVLRRDVRLGRIDIVEAAERAYDFLDAKRGKNLPAQFVTMIKSLLPTSSEALGTLFELLLSPRLSWTVRVLMEDELVDKELSSKGSKLLSHLPSFEELLHGTARLQLKVGRHLGNCWFSDKAPVVDFLLRAARAERIDIVGAFLRSETSSDFLEELDPRMKKERALMESLVHAARQRRHRFDLFAALDDIHKLEGRLR